ncbi:MAG: RNA pyrophosphohydrolase [Alphaproteobacteria bacterium CG_4_10_14_0_8_um_filter_37_21]|nr:MAG: RNA pyrophosphohydrolase [Alphaproteobacteria bacterium CG_4_10_14_0_8_um_filter_37_21]
MIKLYRPCVGAVIINQNNQIFLGERCGIKNSWQMPQGGIDLNESPQDAILREIEEEIGTNKIDVIKESANWHSYILPETILENVRQYWGNGVIGQRQKWFLCKFTGRDQDINLQTSHQEFFAYMWADKKTVMHYCINFKQEVYENILSEFGF